jgi:peptidoglycan LD-endopeptidase CwlK
MSRDTRDLHPVVRRMAEELIVRCQNRNLLIVYTSTYRANQEQDALYAIGRTKPGKKVTNARGGESYHNYRLALDFAVVGADGKINWDLKADVNHNNAPDYTEVGILAEELGFEWGGRWKSFKDYPHLQFTFGLSIKDLQAGKMPPMEDE